MTTRSDTQSEAGPDPERLARWLDTQQAPGHGEPVDVQPLTGG